MHAFEPASRANGPGLRAVVWFQGCTLHCPGCFNPGTHDVEVGSLVDVGWLAQQIVSFRSQVEGVTISGGEPFQQPEVLLDLLVRLADSGLSRLVFTGYTLEEVRGLTLGPQIIGHVDVLIAGRYVVSQHLGRGLLGSANQQIHLLTKRYKPEDFTGVPTHEIILHRDGTITLSGMSRLSAFENDHHAGNK
ncbi:MAG: radical SAM protein [Phycisphaerae bacterium]|nr:radical SAM protein [Phycisphaerae bacterium]